MSSRRAELLAALDRAMRTISAQSVLFSQAAAERLGLNSTDMECLDLLNLNGPVPAGGLAELTGLTTGAITGVVDRLERAGYVRRERDPHDRRKVIVQPILERQAEAAPIFRPMAQAMDELFARYSDEELALILDFATRANAITLEQIARLRAEAKPPVARPPADESAPQRRGAKPAHGSAVAPSEPLTRPP
jgi:DNA-binding MarR family transcriptional regulator